MDKHFWIGFVKFFVFGAVLATVLQFFRAVDPPRQVAPAASPVEVGR